MLVAMFMQSMSNRMETNRSLAIDRWPQNNPGPKCFDQDSCQPEVVP